MYHAVIGKSVLRETNASTGIEICTTWDHTTQLVRRTRQQFDRYRGLVGEAVPVTLAEPDSARKRIARITQMTRQFLG